MVMQIRGVSIKPLKPAGCVSIIAVESAAKRFRHQNAGDTIIGFNLTFRKQRKAYYICSG
ncbi:hypothetical protein [Pantoea stewartii]|uniref:hypothetical protein n=1 Tax=Pantoea stewartii TaxID=66269 RepID=UPI0010708EB6|nr:hypothetical protein [Pantoea stewartii]